MAILLTIGFFISLSVLFVLTRDLGVKRIPSRSRVNNIYSDYADRKREQEWNRITYHW